MCACVCVYIYIHIYIYTYIHTYIYGFPGSSDGKESACNAGDPSSIPELGSSPGEEIGYPLQYSWASLVAQMVKNICPQCRRPGFNPQVGNIPWRREQLPTSVFLPGKSMDKGDWQATDHGVAKESDMISE